MNLFQYKRVENRFVALQHSHKLLLLLLKDCLMSPLHNHQCFILRLEYHFQNRLLEYYPGSKNVAANIHPNKFLKKLIDLFSALGQNTRLHFRNIICPYKRFLHHYIELKCHILDRFLVAFASYLV